MSETLEQPSLLRLIFATPTPQVLRQWYCRRYAWKPRVQTADLPAELRELIFRVVKQTRLWRREKRQVADELIAHFSDAISAGATPAAAIESFGNEALAAKLIRRAKRRNRSITWKVRLWMYRGLGVVILIYSVLLARFCLERPHPTVDYIAQLNAPILATPVDARAWPLWRQAIEGMVEPMPAAPNRPPPSPQYPIPAWLDVPPNETDWPRITTWLGHHQASLDIARAASEKPVMGYVYAAKEAGDKLHLFSSTGSVAHEAMLDIERPPLGYLRRTAICVSLDAELASRRGQSDRAMADIRAMLGLGAQLRGNDQFLITGLDGVGIDGMAADRIGHLLRDHPEVLSDAQWIQLAHLISGPRVAGDLVNLSTEHIAIDDMLQRLFTDDGHGDGHMTLDSVRELQFRVVHSGGIEPLPQPLKVYAAMASVPGLTLSRQQMREVLLRVINQAAANFRQPMRDANWTGVEHESENLGRFDFSRLKSLPVLAAAAYPKVQVSCERYLGQRDGVEVGIALEIYRRHHHAYPASLGALVPEYLPAIPADRITGDPVKYRLIDGKPVVYSVGIDHHDDGGKPPMSTIYHDVRPTAAASWTTPRPNFTAGDWILYPPIDLPSDDSGN